MVDRWMQCCCHKAMAVVGPLMFDGFSDRKDTGHLSYLPGALA
jgi:hypothetical protein